MYKHTPDEELQTADLLTALFGATSERFKQAVKDRNIDVADEQLKYIIEEAQEIVRRLKLARDGKTNPDRRSLENRDKGN